MEEKEKNENNAQQEKESSNGLALGMCLGLAVGTAVGAATGAVALWMPIGLSIGLCLGLAADAQKKKAVKAEEAPDEEEKDAPAGGKD